MTHYPTRRLLALAVVLGSATLGPSCGPGRDGGVGVARAAVELPELVLLSELEVDPPGADGNFEFVELVGPAGASLEFHYLIALEADSSSGRLGEADYVLDLTTACDGEPCRLGDNGLLLVSPPSGPASLEAQTPRVEDEALSGGGLENGSLAMLLLKSTPHPVADYDADDDCVMDLPESSTLVDAVGWTDAEEGDCSYVTDLGTPAPTRGATRYAGEYCAVCSTAWLFGTLTGSPESATYLQGASLTPGGENPLRASPTGGGGVGSSGGPGVLRVSAGAAGQTEAAGGASGSRGSVRGESNAAGADGDAFVSRAGSDVGRWYSPLVLPRDPENQAGAGGIAEQDSNRQGADLPSLSCGCSILGRGRLSFPAVMALAFGAFSLMGRAGSGRYGP